MSHSINYKKIKAAVSEWNGTILRPPNRELNGWIAKAVLNHTAGKVLRGRVHKIMDVYGLMKKKSETKQKLAERDKGNASHRELYQLFNEIIRGQPVDRIKRAVDDYVRTVAPFVEWTVDEHLDENGAYIPKPVDKVDWHLLDALWTLKAGSIDTLVFSHAYDYSICQVLTEQRRSDTVTSVIANTLKEKNGLAVEMTADIRESGIGLFKQKFFDELGLKPDEVLYIGGSKHASALIRKGILPPANVIAAFIAPEQRRKELKELGAFVPPTGYSWAIQHYLYEPELLSMHLAEYERSAAAKTDPVQAVDNA